MRVRGLVGAAVVTAVVGSTLSAPVTQAAAPPPLRTEDAATYTVTLVTGDRVTVARADDTWTIRQLVPAQRFGGHGGFLRQAGPDGVTVIPRDAVPLLRAGRLDDAFFDVTGLIRQGYDDAHTDRIPLLVRAGASAAAFGTVTRQLPDAGLTAVTSAKDTTAYDLVRADPGARIWLNGKAFPTLDESVPQVGAPDAWAAGQTGAGATIAVLDTGYDPTHPDLAGVVTGERDFVGAPSGIRDEVGHGTHVASTAAGRGTASGGRYTGVAKGANLMIGKVCDVGGCPFDAILAGMRWAAESGARVVNMSIGGGESDGTDPIETELNRLSAEHGTLFVVAAGNYGGYEQVSTPAAADAALAVASVSKQDVPSEFSSRGPRVGDFALKPDIAAPGEAVVAARAAGTLPDEAVDDHHARLDGTSMATPHVAGAAAILAAAHPDWTGERIKSTLMSTAHPVEAGVYEQGAGRLDVGRAVTQPVTASPASLSMGFVRWPHDGPAPEPKAVTYRNAGPADVTLTLALDTWDSTGAPAPAGMFRTDRTEVTVPAGGAATVTVTFDPGAGPVGTYGGRLVATGGDTVVQTTVGGHKEPESYDLTLRMTDRDGKGIPPGSPAGLAIVQNLDDPEVELFPVFSNEPARLPAGRYAVLGIAETPVSDRPNPSLTMLATPEVTLDEDTVLALDARRGNRVGVRVDRSDARVAAGTAGMLLDNGRVQDGYVVGTLDDLYAVPTDGRSEGFLFYTRAQVEQPLVRVAVSAPESFEVPVAWTPQSPTFAGERPLTSVDAGHATPEDIAGADLAGRLAVFTLGAGEEAAFEDRLHALADAGAAAALFYFSERTNIGVGDTLALPTAYTLDPEGARLAGLGTASVTLSAIAASPYRYELALPSDGGIPAEVDYRVRDRDLGTVRAKYHALVDGGVGYLDYGTRAHGFELGGGLWSTVVPLPVERTEYYSAGPVTWDMSVRAAPPRESGPEHGYHAATKRYRAGEKVSVDWHASVVGPSLAVDDERYSGRPHLVYRDGDTVTATLPLLSDSMGHNGTPAPEEYSFADTGDTALYADGTLVSRSGVPGAGEFTVPPGAADYRLTSEVRRNHPVWPVSTVVGAEWTFRSAHTDAATPLPLLTVGFAPKVDLMNRAPAGRRVTIPVTVSRQPGAPGGRTALDRVEFSVDDGVTWQRVRPRAKGDRWEVTVPNPAAGFVSLRAAASDRSGNTVTQTVLRAYRVR